LSRGEIEAAFDHGWRIDIIEPTVLEVTVDPDGVAAWLVALTRM
jgi:hypothetical protein